MKFEICFAALLLLSACKNEPAPPTENPAQADSTTSTPIDNTPIDGAWTMFWNDFRKAVENEHKVIAMGMMHYPLIGTGHLSHQGYKEGIPGDEMRNLYFTVVDEQARFQITPLKAKDVPNFQVSPDNYAGSDEEKAGVQVGSKVYTVNVTVPVGGEASESIQTGIRTYYFGKANGSSYKLYKVKMER